MFINDLPNGKDTAAFVTEDASGSTSQAANVVESMEAGASLLLMDEDTSATNFMIRDELMQRVIHRDMEPITPFLDRIRELYDGYGISTILVAGSSGAYFHIADHIIQMDRYEPRDITDFAKREAAAFPAGDAPLPPAGKPNFDRRPRAGAAFRSGERVKLKTLGRDGVSLNRETIDLRYVRADGRAGLLPALRPEAPAGRQEEPAAGGGGAGGPDLRTGSGRPVRKPLQRRLSGAAQKTGDLRLPEPVQRAEPVRAPRRQGGRGGGAPEHYGMCRVLEAFRLRRSKTAAARSRTAPAAGRIHQSGRGACVTQKVTVCV